MINLGNTGGEGRDEEVKMTKQFENKFNTSLNFFSTEKKKKKKKKKTQTPK